MHHLSKLLLVTAATIGASCASASAPARPWLFAPLPSDQAPPVLEVTSESASTDDPLRTDPAPRWVMLDGALNLAEKGAGNVTIVAGRSLPIASPPAFITVLHASCVDSIETCTFLREIADGRAVLVCPRANVPCDNGGAVWGGGLRAIADIVDESLARAESVVGASAPHEHDILFGSSGGAFAARNLINAGRTGWSGLVLVGAKIQLDIAATRRAGIHRVLLAAPDGDMAAPAMRVEKTTLCRAGIPARFVSLGRHGHGMDDASPGILAAHMDWVMGLSDDAKTPAGCP